MACGLVAAIAIQHRFKLCGRILRICGIRKKCDGKRFLKMHVIYDFYEINEKRKDLISLLHRELRNNFIRSRVVRRRKQREAPDCSNMPPMSYLTG
jgi:hypothetical protein